MLSHRFQNAATFSIWALPELVSNLILIWALNNKTCKSSSKITTVITSLMMWILNWINKNINILHMVPAKQWGKPPAWLESHLGSFVESDRICQSSIHFDRISASLSKYCSNMHWLTSLEFVKYTHIYVKINFHKWKWQQQMCCVNIQIYQVSWFRVGQTRTHTTMVSCNTSCKSIVVKLVGIFLSKPANYTTHW